MSYYNRNCCCPGASGYGAYGSYYGMYPRQVWGMGAIGSGTSSGSDIRKTFNCEAVWADAQLGGSIGQIIAAGNAMGCKNGVAPEGSGDITVAACKQNWQEQGRANVAGLRALDNIRRALTELGYKPAPIGSAYGAAADKEAWASYSADRGVPGPYVSKPLLCAMEQDLKSGKGGKGLSKAGLAVAAIAGLAVVGAVIASKKKAGAHAAKAIIPTH